MKLINRFYSLLALLFVGSASLQAQSDPFPELNFRLYQLNISLTAQVIQYGNVVEDALVAAFCGDEIRGKKNVGDGTQPDILYMPVYGDYKGEYQYLHFKVYTGGKVFTYHPEPALDWEDCYVYYNQMVGSTSSPYIIDITPVSLANDVDNSSVLTNIAGQTCDIALTGRTLYKDGAWNTLCLPFSLTEDEVTAYLAPDALMTLKNSAFDNSNGTLTLNFENTTTIEAGKPYIVKWTTTGDNIVNPVFSNVLISTANANVPTDYADFCGTYTYMGFTAEDKSILFLGQQSTLYYPQAGASIGACRAYFQLNGITAGDPTNGVRQFVMNFGDEETGIRSLTPDPSPKGEGSSYWYSIDGRKLDGRPTKKGLYIHGGKTVVIRSTTK